MTITSRQDCTILDAKDELAHKRAEFVLPSGKIYLDGNSLGCMPVHAPARMAEAMTEEWGQSLITSWNRHGWFEMTQKLGGRIARIIGASEGTVLVGDTISINLFKLMSSALQLQKSRQKIVSDTGNFPSDLYIAQGLIQQLDRGHQLVLTEPEQILGAIDNDTALVSISHIDYRTARAHDLAAIVAKAHAHGALVLVDLSHTTGTLAIDLTALNVDFAVGCTYKYVNGGPGAPGFLYVRSDLQERIQPALSGWLGHVSPFEFGLDYRPAKGILRNQCGTPPILSLIGLACAMDVFDALDMHVLHAKAHRLCHQFITHVSSFGHAYGLSLAGPTDMAERGSHVSFHWENGYAVMQALIAEGVVGDFRAPDMIRFGFAPLYNNHVEVFDAAEKLRDILATRRWDAPQFLAKKAVT